MIRWRIIVLMLICIFFTASNGLKAQCSICTKTAMQQGEKPASGLNSGIIYLMLTPFAVVGYIGYRWYKTERHLIADDGNHQYN